MKPKKTSKAEISYIFGDKETQYFLDDLRLFALKKMPLNNHQRDILKRIRLRYLEDLDHIKEQGKKETLEKLLKDAKKHLEEYDINSSDLYMRGYVGKCKRDIIYLKQKLKEK